MTAPHGPDVVQKAIELQQAHQEEVGYLMTNKELAKVLKVNVHWVSKRVPSEWRNDPSGTSPAVMAQIKKDTERMEAEQRKHLDQSGVPLSARNLAAILGLKPNRVYKLLPRLPENLRRPVPMTFRKVQDIPDSVAKAAKEVGAAMLRSGTGGKKNRPNPKIMNNMLVKTIQQAIQHGDIYCPKHKRTERLIWDCGTALEVDV